MSNWIKILPMALREIEKGEFCDPEKEVNLEEDHVVGEMSEDLKRIYTTWINLQESADRAILEAKYAKGDDQRKELTGRAKELHAKTEALEIIFWISVRDEFELWDKSSIGVRKNFQIVWSDEGPPKTFLDFLRGM